MARPANDVRRQIPRGSGESAPEADSSGVPDDAAKEAKQLSRGLSTRDLKKEAEEHEHDRSEKFKDHFELIAIIIVWGLFGAFCILGVVWLLTLVLPPWVIALWLSPAQVSDIKGILTGGVIAGLIADHVRRRMS